MGPFVIRERKKKNKEEKDMGNGPNVLEAERAFPFFRKFFSLF